MQPESDMPSPANAESLNALRKVLWVQVFMVISIVSYMSFTRKCMPKTVIVNI